MKRYILPTVLVLAILTVGCGQETTVWRVKYVPTTSEERVAVSDLQARMMQCLPQTVGRDQDLDDFVRAVHEAATKSVCKPTLWECERSYPLVETGVWVSFEEGGVQNLTPELKARKKPSNQ